MGLSKIFHSLSNSTFFPREKRASISLLLLFFFLFCFLFDFSRSSKQKFTCGWLPLAGSYTLIRKVTEDKNTSAERFGLVWFDLVWVWERDRHPVKHMSRPAVPTHWQLSRPVEDDQGPVQPYQYRLTTCIKRPVAVYHLYIYLYIYTYIYIHIYVVTHLIQATKVSVLRLDLYFPDPDTQTSWSGHKISRTSVGTSCCV